MIKITIVSGFLGAGKTTLIRKLLKESLTDEKVVLVENEFGEIGIDAGFLKDTGIEMKEMNSGCICCSLVGDFGKALQEVMEKYKPERILIEPSGVGKLSDVVRAVNDAAAASPVPTKLTGKTVVVDAKKCRMYLKNFGEFFQNQVENADTILLSRVEGLTEDKVQKCVALLKEYNKTAVIITTPLEELDGKKILNLIEENKPQDIILDYDPKETECDCGHEHSHGENCSCGGHHHAADEVFSSIGIETVRKFTKDELKNILDSLEDESQFGRILRAKGIVSSDGKDWFHFDYVPGESEIRTGDADYTGRICVIGSQLSQETIRNIFHA